MGVTAGGAQLMCGAVSSTARPGTLRLVRVLGVAYCWDTACPIVIQVKRERRVYILPYCGDLGFIGNGSGKTETV